METNENKIDVTQEKLNALHEQIADLEAQVSVLKSDAKKIGDNVGNYLLKQIEVLAIFAVFISLAITNVIGIDVLGSLGLRGIAMIDMGYIASALVLLFGIKYIIIGFKNK